MLSAIVEQRPTETIVVINGARNEELEQVCRDLGVRWAWTTDGAWVDKLLAAAKPVLKLLA